MLALSLSHVHQLSLGCKWYIFSHLLPMLSFRYITASPAPSSNLMQSHNPPGGENQPCFKM